VQDTGETMTIRLSARSQLGQVIPGLELTVTPK
jgi:hypothetical protein